MYRTRVWGSTIAALMSSLLTISGCIHVPAAASTSKAAQSSNAAGSLHASRALSELYTNGETRAYVFLRDGARLGRADVRIELIEAATSDTHIHFEAKVEWIGANGQPQRLVQKVELDERGYLFQAEERSASFVWRYQATPEGFLVTEDTGLGDPKSRTIRTPPDVVPLAFMAPWLVEAAMMSRDMQAKNEWMGLSLASATLEDWSFVARRTDGETLRMQTSLGEQIEVVSNRLASIKVPDDHIEVVVEKATPFPTWELAPIPRLGYELPDDARFKVEPFVLSATNDGLLSLAGELLVPMTNESSLPAVLFLGPSVGADRYGFAGPPAVDLGSHAWTDALANAGYVVARFDEPGFGSSPRSEDAGFLRGISDARRVLGQLLLDARIDPERVYIVAHGQGAWRALALASRLSRQLAGLILLAPAWRPLQVQFGDDSAMLDVLHSEVLSAMPEVRWMQEAARFQPLEVATSVKVPICVGLAQFDAEVRLEEALPRTRELIEKHREVSGDNSFVVPAVDHLFMPVSALGEATDAYRKARPVSELALSKMLDCLRAFTPAVRQK